jgi:hypothetical protein
VCSGGVQMVYAAFERQIDYLTQSINDLLRFFHPRQLRMIELNI